MGLASTERTTSLSKHIRFTNSQDKRLEDVCTYLGCTLQSFIHEATLERLAKVEAEQRSNKEYRERSKKESSRRREIRGLGLRSNATVAEPPPAPAPQVVVNVPAAPSAAGDASMLATFVAKGSILERASRLEHVHEVLAASLDGAALKAAKKALDDAVAATAPKSGVLDWFKK